MAQFNVLVVCTGNICRSPMGEHLLKHKLEKMGYKDFNVSSAGVMGLQGSRPTEEAVIAMKRWNVDISSHRAKLLKPEMVALADLVLCMEPGHVEAVLEMVPDAEDYTFLWDKFSSNHPTQAIEDPLGGKIKDYYQTAENLRLGMNGIANYLKKRFGPPEQ